MEEKEIKKKILKYQYEIEKLKLDLEKDDIETFPIGFDVSKKD